MKSPTTRLLLGVAALACLAAGGIVAWQAGTAEGSVLIRSGLVLGAVWVAWPVIIKVDPRWLLPVVVGLIVAVTRPALLVGLLPLLIGIGFVRRSAKKQGGRS